MSIIKDVSKVFDDYFVDYDDEFDLRLFSGRIWIYYDVEFMNDYDLYNKLMKYIQCDVKTFKKLRGKVKTFYVNLVNLCLLSLIKYSGENIYLGSYKDNVLPLFQKYLINKGLNYEIVNNYMFNKFKILEKLVNSFEELRNEYLENDYLK